MAGVRYPQSILDYQPYRAAYDAPYRQICGDSTSFADLDENAFREFITQNFSHLGRFRLASHLAEDYKDALTAFLNNGFGCPDTSAHKQRGSSMPTMSVAARPRGTPSSQTVAIRTQPQPQPQGEDERPTGEYHIPPELARRWDSGVSGLPQPSAQLGASPPPRPLPEAPSAPARPGASPLPRPLPPRLQTPPAPVTPPPPSPAETPGRTTQMALEAAAFEIDSSPTGDPRMTQVGAAAPREPLPRFTVGSTGTQTVIPALFPTSPPALRPPAPVAPPPAPAATPATAPTSSPRITSAVTRDLPAQRGPQPSSPAIPPPPPAAPAAAQPAAPAQIGTMSENVFMANYQRLQADIGNVHLAYLTGVRGDSVPVEMIYGLLINESIPSRQGKLESNIAVAPYKLRFIINPGGIIRRIDLLNPELNPYVQIITRLVDEYNVDQMGQLEFRITGDPSINDQGRRNLGEAIYVSREYAMTPPRVIGFGESSGETSEMTPAASAVPSVAPAAPSDSGPPPVEQASIVPPAALGGMRIHVLGGAQDVVTGNRPLAGPIPPARPVAVGSPSAPAPALTTGSGSRRVLPETFTAPPAGTRASTPPATDADPFAVETPRIRTSATNLANALRTAGSAQARLAAWQNIQIQYLSLLGKLARLIETESARVTLPGAFGVQSRQAILSMAKNTDIFAGIVFTTAWDVTKPFTNKPKTAEQAFLLTQMKMISEVRKSVAELAKIIDPDHPSTPRQVSEAVSAMQTELDTFNNPIVWTDKFLTTIREFGGKFSRRLARVTSSTQGNWSNVEFQNPQRYIDLIGKMLLFVSDSHWSRFFRIRNRKIKLNFEWVRTPAVINKKGVIKKPEEMKLVVSSRSYDFGGWFRGMRWHANGLRQLVNEMGGEWHNPNRIGRFLRLFLAFIPAVRRSRAHRLIVPISIVQEGSVVVSGSGMSTPPTPVSGGPAAGATPSTVTGLVNPDALGETIAAGHPVDPSVSHYSHSARTQQAQRHLIQQRQGWMQNAQRTWRASAAAAAVRVPVRVR